MVFKGKKVLVLGNGTSGKGAREALESVGAKVTVADTPVLPRGMSAYDCAVVSPGIRHDHPIYRYADLHDLPVFGEIGLGAMLNTAPIVAVTGTNGKTTTVGMLGKIYEAAGIRVAVCGNIGKSFAQTAVRGGYDRVILELSSFQLLQAAPLKAHIAVITNLSEDHLDYHGSMLEYRHAKLRIADGQTAEDVLIVPSDLNLVGMRGKPTVKIAEQSCGVVDGVLTAENRPIIKREELPLLGEHNVQNALNAALAALSDGIGIEAIAEGLKNFRVKAHRLAIVGQAHGVTFFNDSKGTNVAATLAAVRCMQGSTALILGGSDKGYRYEPLFDGLPDGTAVFVTGGNAACISEGAAKSAFGNIEVCESLEEAVRRAAASGAENVLFSPASASFDRYANYKERGKAFESEVEKLLTD